MMDRGERTMNDAHSLSLALTRKEKEPYDRETCKPKMKEELV